MQREDSQCPDCRRRAGRIEETTPTTPTHVVSVGVDIKPKICSTCGACFDPCTRSGPALGDSLPLEGADHRRSAADVAHGTVAKTTRVFYPSSEPAVFNYGPERFPIDYQSQQEETEERDEAESWYPLAGSPEISVAHEQGTQQEVTHPVVKTEQNFWDDDEPEERQDGYLGGEQSFPEGNHIVQLNSLLETTRAENGHDGTSNHCPSVGTNERPRDGGRFNGCLPDFGRAVPNAQYGSFREDPSHAVATGTESADVQPPEASTTLAEIDPAFRSRKRRSTCGICGKVFSSYAALSKHSRTHAPDLPYQCEQCGKAFVEKNKLRSHQLVHTGETRRYRCDVCGKAFMSKYGRDHHVCHAPSPTTLPARFESEFAGPGAFLDRGYDPIIDRPHECGICGQCFVTKKKLDSHLWTHEQNGLPDSDEYSGGAGQEFYHNAAPTDLSWAVYQSRQGITFRRDFDKYTITSKRPYGCQMCGKTFATVYHLERHKMTHSKVKPHPCGTCGKGFVSRSDLQKHVRVHTGERPYACDQCDKAYTQSCGLTKHKREKHQDSVYTSYQRKKNIRFCKVCAKGFASDAHLRAHVRVHTGEKPHQCNVCHRRFAHNHHLSRHMLIHTGEKPHECWVCGDKFRYSTDMTIHIRTHTGEKPYNCAQCEECFISRFLLKAHIAKCHAEKPEPATDAAEGAKRKRRRKRKQRRELDEDFYFGESDDESDAFDMKREPENGYFIEQATEAQNGLHNGVESYGSEEEYHVVHLQPNTERFHLQGEAENSSDSTEQHREVHGPQSEHGRKNGLFKKGTESGHIARLEHGRDASTRDHVTLEDNRDASTRDHTLGHDGDAGARDRDTLGHDRNASTRNHRTLGHDGDAGARDRDTLGHDRDASTRDHDTLIYNRDAGARGHDTLGHDRHASIRDPDTLGHDRDAAARDHDTLGHDRHASIRDPDTLGHDRDAAARDLDTLGHDRNSGARDHDTLGHDRDASTRGHDTLGHDRDAGARGHDTLGHYRDASARDYEILGHERDAGASEHGAFISDRDARTRDFDTSEWDRDTGTGDHDAGASCHDRDAMERGTSLRGREIVRSEDRRHVDDVEMDQTVNGTPDHAKQIANPSVKRSAIIMRPENIKLERSSL